MDYPLSQGPDGEQEILSFSYLTFHMNKQISMTIWIKKQSCSDVPNYQTKIPTTVRNREQKNTKSCF